MVSLKFITQYLPAFGADKDVKRDSAAQAEKDGLLYGTTITGRGELRAHLFVMHIANIMLFAMLFYILYCHSQEIQQFIKNGYVVVTLDKGRAVGLPAADFRFAATDEELQRIALDTVTNILEYSAQNVEWRFEEAKRAMSPTMRTEFQANFGSAIPELKKLEIYTKFDNRAVQQDPNNRYRVLVSGRIIRYRYGQALTNGPATFQVDFLGLENRTIDYPSAAMVDSIIQLNGTFNVRGNTLERIEQQQQLQQEELLQQQPQSQSQQSGNAADEAQSNNQTPAPTAPPTAAQAPPQAVPPPSAQAAPKAAPVSNSAEKKDTGGKPDTNGKAETSKQSQKGSSNRK